MLLQEDDAESAETRDAADGAPRLPRVLEAAALVGLLAVPFVVATVAYTSPTWYAHDDLALTEMHVRDVFTSSPPLVGLGGRIQANGVPGNHPGPLSFFLLAPVYRLLGSSSWAMQVSQAVLGLVAIGLAVWMGRRRGGRTGMLAAATGMVVLLVAYGPERWMLPWNPDLPLLWWPVVLLAAWSVLCRDWPMVLVFALAASFCAQTHISYVGMIAGLGLMLAVWMGWAARAARAGRTDNGEDDDGGPTGDSVGASTGGSRGRGPLAWLLAGLGLLVVLWLPPIIDQVADEQGNASVIVRQFLDPDDTADPTAGWGAAFDVAFDRLDPWAVVSGSASEFPAASAGGVVGVAAWVVAAAVAVARRRGLPPSLLPLHAVVAVAAVLGLVSISRVQGRVFAYLTLWWWGTAVVMVAATAWTAIAVARARGRARSAGADGRPTDRWARAAAGGRVALVGALAIGLVVASVQAARPDPLERGNRIRTHAEVFPAAFDALAEGRVDGFGPDDRYHVRAVDGHTGDLSAFTVLNEMERRGFEAGIGASMAHAVGDDRVIEPGEATAIVTYASGPAIEDMRADPDATEIASADLRPDEAAAAATARADAAAALERSGDPELVPLVDRGLFAILVADEDLPDDVEEPLLRLVDIGAPIAIFVSPAPDG